MKKLLLAASVLALAAASANAGTIQLMVQEDGGTTMVPICSGSVCSISTPIMTADYTVDTFSGTTVPSTASPFLLQGQSIDVGSAGSTNVLHLTVLGQGLTGPTGLQTLASGFAITGDSDGWSVTETTDINGTIVGSHTFTGPLSNGADTDFLSFNLTAPFTASLHYDISSNNVAGSANVNSALAAVPGPIAGAGLPGLILASGVLLMLARRRQKSA